MSSSFVKTSDEIMRLRRSCAGLAEVLTEVLAAARPGVSTLELDTLAEKRIREQGGIPVFKGYGAQWGHPPFPGTICASLNEEVVHGIAKADCILKEGDILKVDIGMRLDGMVSDMARTVPIGNVSSEAEKLLETTERSLLAGIEAMRPGGKIKDFSRAVQEVAEGAGYGVVRDMVGHSVGRELHEDLQVPNYVAPGMHNFTLEPGMTLALEPMVNVGTWQVDTAPDGWTVVTRDGSLSAHFEDPVLVTEEGIEILTRA